MLPSTPMKQANVSSLRVIELRAELSTRNLSPKGVKKDLVKRLQDALAKENGDEDDEEEDVDRENQSAEEPEEEDAEGAEKELEGEKEEENGNNKLETPAKKTSKRNASAGNVAIEPRRSNGRKGSNVVSKSSETPARTTSRPAAVADPEITDTPSREKDDQVMGDEEATRDQTMQEEEYKQEERQDTEKDAQEQGNGEQKDVEMEENNEAEATVEEESASKVSAPVTDEKAHDALESQRKRTRSSDEEGEKPTEKIAPSTVTVASPEEPVTVNETKETEKVSPHKELPKHRDENRAKDATEGSPERTIKRRRKEEDEEEVDGGAENSKIQVEEEQIEQRSEEKEIPKTKTPVTSPQKIKRIYSPIKAPTEPTPKKKVPENLEAIATEPPRSEPSPCIYINGLHRPLTVVMLKKKLGECGNVEKIWLDRIKTRCYALFSDKASAVLARNEMNDSVWPPNTGRTLTVEYLPTHRYDELVAEEEKAMESGKKLVLTPDSDPSIAVRLVEMFGISLPSSSSSSAKAAPSASSVHAPAPSSRQRAGSFGRALETRMRDAPLGRRISVPETSASPSASSIAASAKLIPLDTLFRKTTAKPHLYYLPLTDEQVSEKKIRAGRGVADSRRN